MRNKNRNLAELFHQILKRWGRRWLAARGCVENQLELGNWSVPMLATPAWRTRAPRLPGHLSDCGTAEHRQAVEQAKYLCRAKRKVEWAKAQVGVKVEHPFRVIKHQFGYVKVRFRAPSAEHCATNSEHPQRKTSWRWAQEGEQ